MFLEVNNLIKNFNKEQVVKNLGLTLDARHTLSILGTGVHLQ